MPETAEVPRFKLKNLFVVEDRCEFAADYSRAKIVVECMEAENFPFAIESLASMNARNLALGYASHSGVSNPRINANSIGPYAVNIDGMALEDVKGSDGKMLDLRHPKMQPAKYRADIPVIRKLG